MPPEKLFKQICLRCENHAKNFVCEDMMTCPAHELYIIASDKIKTIYKKDDWATPPTPRQEMI